MFLINNQLQQEQYQPVSMASSNTGWRPSTPERWCRNISIYKYKVRSVIWPVAPFFFLNYNHIQDVLSLGLVCCVYVLLDVETKLAWLAFVLSLIVVFMLPWCHQRYERFTLSVEEWEVESTLGSVMLLIRFRMFWIFWSEILMCIRGSSPETLNLKDKSMCLQHI